MISVQGNTPEFARLSVEQYHAMIPAGILHEGAPIELTAGLLIKKDRRDENPAVTGAGF